MIRYEPTAMSSHAIRNGTTDCAVTTSMSAAISTANTACAYHTGRCARSCARYAVPNETQAAPTNEIVATNTAASGSSANTQSPPGTDDGTVTATRTPDAS